MNHNQASWREEGKGYEEEEGACGGVPMSASLSSGTDQVHVDSSQSDNIPANNIPASTPVTDSGDGRSEMTVITDQEEFLNKIQQTFLEMVRPIESLLVDSLRHAEALSSEDEQSIAGENTRRKKARKFWSVLHRIPEEDFAGCFVPKLQEAYPHVMAGLDFRLTDRANVDNCLRHAIRRRINLKRLIDLLPSVQCCSVEEYRELMANQRCGDREWEEVFQRLCTHCSNPDLCSAMETMLRKKKIRNPERYREVAVGGFVCTCHVTSPSLCSPDSGIADENPVLKAIQYLRVQSEAGSSATYPSSPLSCRSGSQDLTDGICADSGLGVDEAVLQPVLLSDLQQFQTTTHKSRYKEVENEINSALTRTSNIRTNFRYLEKIRDDARSLAKQAKDETPSKSTNKELQRLLKRAMEFLSDIQGFFQELQGTWECVRDLEGSFDFDLPEDWRMYLRHRHHLLRNEMQECRHFVEKAATVFEEVSRFSQPLPLAE